MAPIRNSPLANRDEQGSLNQLRDVIERAGQLLPAQGPITAFVFLNTLQALEDLPFEEGLLKGAKLFGVQPYLSEDRYREKMARGRIRLEDLSIVLRRDLAERADVKIDALTTNSDVRMAMLRFPLQTGPVEELRWFVAETDALTHFSEDAPPAARTKVIEETKRWVMRDLRDGGDDSHRGVGAHGTHDQHLHDDLIRRFGESSIESWSEKTWEAFSLRLLWRVCRDGISHCSPSPCGSVDSCGSSNHPGHKGLGYAIRHRDVLLRATKRDSDELVHEVLIRFCAAFTDQGFAGWKLPVRDHGFYRAFCEVYRLPAGPPDRWMLGLSSELVRLETAGIGPLESIRESLDLLGVRDDEQDDCLTASLLALRGWAGMIWQMEDRPDRVALSVPPGSLVEFLAVRLILERVALAHVAAESLDYRGSLAGLREAVALRNGNGHANPVEGRALLVFQLAQILGWSPLALHRLTEQDWSALVTEIEDFTEVERRRLFHQAFERRFRRQALDAISIHTRRESKRVESPRFQAAFCIDTREESFRRHLEEVASDVETFSTAGFFNVPIYYRGVADAHFSTLCPIVVRPKHWITEEVVYSLEEEDRRRAKTRRAIGAATHSVHVGSRSIARGAVLTASLGVLASVPLVARVLFPRMTARIRKTVGRFVEAPRVTRLRLERTEVEPGPEGNHIGFNLEEMANIGERVLRDIGLTSSFARLFLFFGHGSFCLNNPHKSSYDCGACSGGAGGPNARALAAILNDPRVRSILASRSLNIPAETLFLGGLHNTCSDTLMFYDLDLLPKSHLADFEAARDSLDIVCQRNAHERCRRFQSAPLNLSISDAHKHVEGRSEDLAQTRPEFGNATNAVCFVGRRERLRGLYLDRRCFMQSYDPAQDDERLSILGRILAPVVPVCEGINLQYFFSYIDSPGWGCGTKLPHNVTSLLGVMDGAASDLRPGLPWQGVEIHEPVRLLFVIETTPEGILQIMDRDPLVGKILKNGWSQLALLNPQTSEVLVYRAGEFHPYQPDITELPRAASSLDWYRGQREHLEFAEIIS
ncbi:MAG: DUF2309 domain-containing protein [Planctomycetales bacterium]|nr:DUF2309 domain-containing protein [Planctomycetales bacterium]